MTDVAREFVRAIFLPPAVTELATRRVKIIHAILPLVIAQRRGELELIGDEIRFEVESSAIITIYSLGASFHEKETARDDLKVVRGDKIT